jgi:hypothetical protein
MFRPGYFRSHRGFISPWFVPLYYGSPWTGGPCIGGRCGGWFAINDMDHLPYGSVPVMEYQAPRPTRRRELPIAPLSKDNWNMPGNMNTPRSYDMVYDD